MDPLKHRLRRIRFVQLFSLGVKPFLVMAMDRLDSAICSSANHLPGTNHCPYSTFYTDMGKGAVRCHQTSVKSQQTGLFFSLKQQPRARLI